MSFEGETAWCEKCSAEVEKEDMLVTWDEFFVCEECYKSGDTLDVDDMDDEVNG